MISGHFQPPQKLLSPQTQNGGGSGGSSSENVCVPNRCVVRNELGEGKCAVKGRGRWKKTGVIGSPLTSQAPPPALPQDSLAPPSSRGPYRCFRNTLLLGGAVGKTAPLIGRFIRDCSVIYYHNNPLREANRPGGGYSEAQPNQFKGKTPRSPLSPSLCSPLAIERLRQSPSVAQPRLPRSAGGGRREPRL